MALDFDSLQYLTFDCYGTLINWERGILGALQPILRHHDVHLSDDAVLAVYGEFEPRLQNPYRRYREVLRGIVKEFGKRFGFQPIEGEVDSLPASLPAWTPYPDTVDALERLSKKWKLVILSNIDDDLFAASAPKLGVRFDAVVTAEQVKSYKPNHAHWLEMLHRCNTTSDRILHVGQSIYHDVIPARALGCKTVWVHRQPGFGATRPAEERPHLEVRSLTDLAHAAGV